MSDDSSNYVPSSQQTAKGTNHIRRIRREGNDKEIHDDTETWDCATLLRELVRTEMIVVCPLSLFHAWAVSIWFVRAQQKVRLNLH